MDRNIVMQQWDIQRAAIAYDDTSSAPRDWFETLLDVLDDDKEIAISAERVACIEDVRIIGGKFAIECEELILMRSNHHLYPTLPPANTVPSVIINALTPKCNALTCSSSSVADITIVRCPRLNPYPSHTFPVCSGASHG